MRESNNQSSGASPNEHGARTPEEERLDARQRHVLRMRRAREKRELEILDDYHRTSIRQSRTSFWVGLVFGALAFVFVAWTATSAIRSGQYDESAVKLLGEVVAIAYSTLLLRQAREARELLVSFLDKLRADRTMEEIFELARIIDDEEIRAKVKALLALASKASKDLEDTKDLEAAKNSRYPEVWTKFLEDTELLKTVLKPKATAPVPEAQERAGDEV